MNRLPTYPDALESWWIQRAALFRQRTPAPTIARAFEGDVRALHQRFTAGRQEMAKGYAQHLRLWLAYGLFYFPQTFMRVRFILEELQKRGWALPEAPRVIDLGAGSGAASAALCSFERPQAQLTLLDRETAGLDLAYDLLLQTYGVRATTRKGDLTEPPEGSWDVILVSYALNEAWTGLPDERLGPWLQSLKDRLTPGGVLILCEPLIDTHGLYMDRIRNRALREVGLHILAPCPHEQACPLAVRREACHDVRRWRLPPTAQMLNDRLGRSIEDLKFSFLALSANPLPAGEDAFRLVAPVHTAKGKWELKGCTAQGDLRLFEILKRDLKDGERRQLDDFERGMRIHLHGVTRAGDAWRGRLSPEESPSPSPRGDHDTAGE